MTTGRRPSRRSRRSTRRPIKMRSSAFRSPRRNTIPGAVHGRRRLTRRRLNSLYIVLAFERIIRMRSLAGLLAVTSFVATPALGWDTWGGDAGGTRFSKLDQITPGNVDRLVRAWDYRTGDLESRPPEAMKRTKFEATPLFVEDSLILCSPFNEVIALDPGTGQQKWRFDAKISTTQRPGNRYNCRGVTHWVDDRAADGAACRSRIFMGTNDARLIALDAKTGMPCAAFGNGGEVKIDIGESLLWPGEFQITSAPVVTRGVVVVGSAISDNVRVEAPLGTVRAF